jgi:hypothetical protein
MTVDPARTAGNDHSASWGRREFMAVAAGARAAV